MSTNPVGLLGLGLVGSALYGRLLSHGIPVVGYDIDPHRIHTLVEEGGTAAESAAAVGDRCEVVFVAVLRSDQALEAILGPDGLLSGRAATTDIIDTTTADPAASESLATKLSGRNVSYLDAPLSGSSSQISHGDGVFLVGGERTAYERRYDLLGVISEKRFYLGPPGSGSKAKIATNLVLGLNRLALAEGLVFADLIGLDLRAFVELVKVTPAYSRAVDVKAEKMLSGDFSPQSKIAQHRKDLDIILALAERMGQPLPLAKVHHDILAEAESGGLADADTSAVIEQLRRMAK